MAKKNPTAVHMFQVFYTYSKYLCISLTKYSLALQHDEHNTIMPMF